MFVSLWSALALSLLGTACMPLTAPPTVKAPTLEVSAAGAIPTWMTSADMGRSLPVHEGILQRIVDEGGAAWDPTSAKLGQPGTTVLFGHRVSHGGPFRTIAQLHQGSAIALRGSDGRTYTYEVVRTQVTQPTWSAVLAFTPSSGRGLILVACHPLGSSRLRFVVDADLTGVG